MFLKAFTRGHEGSNREALAWDKQAPPPSVSEAISRIVGFQSYSGIDFRLIFNFFHVQIVCAFCIKQPKDQAFSSMCFEIHVPSLFL